MKSALEAFSRSSQYSVSKNSDGRMIIRLHGRIDVETAGLLIRDLTARVKAESPHALAVDLDKVSHFDDFGALLLLELKSLMPESEDTFALLNIGRQPREFLSQIDFENQAICKQPQKPGRSLNLLVRLGESTLLHTFNVRLMIAFIGSVVLAFGRILKRPKSLRVEDTINYMESTGVEAIPIVAMISFLLGLIIAFMSSLQLRQFGADIYVASLVALAMVSELGPIMTAIIVAGRTGSAFAAEIGTMKISEEVDALFSMGFDPTLFLVVPRVIASVVVVPILTIFANICGIAGGLTIAVLLLNISPGTYIDQSINALTLFELSWGLFKSAVFALLVAWVSCLRGFQARGGASAVGNAATSAVVSSIFLIILFDAFFAVIRSYYWG